MEELKFSSFDVAQMVFDDANERFAPPFVMKEDRMEIFRQYCSVVDMILKEFNGETLEISMDESSMQITVRIGIDSLIVDRPERSLIMELLSGAESFAIEKGDDSPLLLTLVFPSLWERAD